ncbi:TIGR03364 family FAD-dependent oxidoreductase [Sphingobacteriales bacterium UPWRP_1]|nr:oxidase [Sphingobacteriales bacterium TSM_CSM]PSJ73791.1 TIGR03364 family FAD-dependent oxidoreductase [Sphingobacteriales bacterium UPWRP_1]
MTSNNYFDLIVVGGGVLGTFHALHALSKGLKVALFEKNRFPVDATVRNFGQIVPSGMNLKWQAYGRKSLEIYQSIQAKADIGIRQNGSIYLASNDDELQLIAELHHINRQNNYPSQLLSTAQCVKKYPSLNTAYCKGGLFFEQELSANPRVMIVKLQQYLAQNNRFYHFPGTLITTAEASGTQCVVRSSQGNTWFAGKVLICSGSDFKTLFPQLFMQSDLQVVKLQMLRLLPQRHTHLPGNILTGLSIRRYESFSECPSYTSIKEKENSDTFWKKWGIHILFKQEEDGSVILGDSHEYADAADADTLGFDLRTDVNQYFIEEGKKIFHLEHWNIDTQWAGFYSQCKQHDLHLQTPDTNLHIITGIGGKGMTASAGFAFENIHNLFGA